MILQNQEMKQKYMFMKLMSDRSCNPALSTADSCQQSNNKADNYIIRIRTKLIRIPLILLPFHHVDYSITSVIELSCIATMYSSNLILKLKRNPKNIIRYTYVQQQTIFKELWFHRSNNFFKCNNNFK